MQGMNPDDRTQGDDGHILQEGRNCWRLAQGGLRAMFLLRLIPVAPFPVVNMVAGASRVRPRYFLFGTLVGVLPSLIVLTLVADRIRAVIDHRTPLAIGWLAATVLLTIAAAYGLWRLLRHPR